MDGPGTVRLHAAFGAAHGPCRLGHIHLLPVTQDECLTLTAGQALDLGLDQAQGLGTAGFVGGIFGATVVGVG